MKLAWRSLASAVALLYFLSPIALVFAQTQVPPPTCALSLNTSVISVGGSVTLSWQSSNATAGNITGVGSVGPSGSINLLPSSASQTTFVGTFTGPGGTGQCQATVSVSTSGGGGPVLTQPTTGASVPITSNTTTVLPQQTVVGLVPCGTGTFDGNGADQGSSTGCQACNLAQLIQLIINFCIGLSIPIAAALFAYAGVLYFTSGTNHNNIDKAKDIFKNAFIGFVIAITGWLVVNTLLHALLDGGQLFGSSGSWFTIQCNTDTNARPVNTNINQVLSSLPMLSTSGGSSPYPGSTGSISTDGTTAGGITPAQQTLIDNCSSGDQSACDQVSQLASQNGNFAAAIAAGAANYYGTNTSSGPDGGNKACAWAINNILAGQGIAPIDSTSVADMQAALNNGRGTPIDPSAAQPGDLVVWKTATVSHVGVVSSIDPSTGQAVVLSNSSSNASFTNKSGINFLGVQGQVYQVNN